MCTKTREAVFCLVNQIMKSSEAKMNLSFYLACAPLLVVDFVCSALVYSYFISEKAKASIRTPNSDASVEQAASFREEESFLIEEWDHPLY